MDKLTVLRNKTSFNLEDMNLSMYTMSYARRLESEYTHTHIPREHNICNRGGATEKENTSTFQYPDVKSVKTNYLMFQT